MVTSGCYGEGPSDLAQPSYAYSLPQVCAVTVKVSTYRFGLFLPTEAKWNGRFLAVVSAHWEVRAGQPGNANLREQGKLCIPRRHQLGGHDTRSKLQHGHPLDRYRSQLRRRRSQLVGREYPGLKEDWGYAALNGSIYYGKQLTEKYYGKKISYSYYTGCSTGGRQGLKQIQVNQSSIDGALIGAPAWREKYLMPWYSSDWYL